MFPLYFIVLIGMIGFGVVFPLIPFFAERAGADPNMIGLIISAYAVGQLVGGPVFGRLSDTYGRRPVLIVTSFLTVPPYLMLAVADTVTLLLVARFLTGFTAGNISTAYAYAADVSDPAQRAKVLGRVAAAFGAGFFAGPAIGGIFAGTDVETANFVLLSIMSAAFSAMAGIAAFFFLKESLPDEHRKPLALKFEGAVAVADLRLFMQRRVLVASIVVTFLLSQAAAIVQGIMPEWLHAYLGFGPRGIGFLMGYVALVAFLLQSGAVGPIVSWLGEERAARLSAALYGIAFFLLPFVGGLVSLILGLTLIAIGFGIFMPSLQSIVARLSGPHEYGTVMGVQQGAASLARITGPIFAWSVYGLYGGTWVFVAGALSVLPGVLLVLWMTRKSAVSERLAESLSTDVPPAPSSELSQDETQDRGL